MNADEMSYILWAWSPKEINNGSSRVRGLVAESLYNAHAMCIYEYVQTSSKLSLAKYTLTCVKICALKCLGHLVEITQSFMDVPRCILKSISNCR